MNHRKITETAWYPEEKLIITYLSGEIDFIDIKRWEASLKTAFEQIEDNSIFKILVNLHGFKATDIEAHKHYRSIIPLMLADYGWKIGYVDLFDEAENMVFKNTRGIRCVGAAHVHQDKTKIEKYETNFGRKNERFFTDPVEANEWIRALKTVEAGI